jgi:hypothetical protein
MSRLSHLSRVTSTGKEIYMPRMSKHNKLEWSFFLSENGRKKYNILCRHCREKCKQSHRAVVVECRKYASKRGKETA